MPTPADPTRVAVRGRGCCLMQPLLVEIGESGDDIVISRILITRDPLEPL